MRRPKNRRLRVYFAGPLFTVVQRAFNLSIVSALESLGFEVFLPQRDGYLLRQMIETDLDPKMAYRSVYRGDLRAMRRADILIAVLNGKQVDDGTAYEMGYMSDRGKLCVGLQTDPRRRLPWGNNPMIDGGLHHIFTTVTGLLKWAQLVFTTKMVLTIVHHPSRPGWTLMGMQRGGPFRGRIMPPGGKFKRGETAKKCAIRELVEETRATARSRHVQKIGTLIVYYGGIPRDMVHVLGVRKISGAVGKTKPFAARWRSTGTLPWNRMVRGDTNWFPRALAGKPFEAHLFYGRNGWRSFERARVIPLKRPPS